MREPMALDNSWPHPIGNQHGEKHDSQLEEQKDKFDLLQKRLNKRRYLVQRLLQTKQDSILHTHT